MAFPDQAAWTSRSGSHADPRARVLEEHGEHGVAVCGSEVQQVPQTDTDQRGQPRRHDGPASLDSRDHGPPGAAKCANWLDFKTRDGPSNMTLVLGRTSHGASWVTNRSASHQRSEGERSKSHDETSAAMTQGLAVRSPLTALLTLPLRKH